MTRWIILLAIILGSATTQAQRLTIREENDAFTGSDDDYTQGLEVEWMGRPYWNTHRNATARFGFSLRNVFYTPGDITVAEDQPDDRPWGGLTALTLKRQQQLATARAEQQLMLGVVGPWSYSKDIQIWWHHLGGFKRPEGWDNQIKNEVIVNWTHLYLYPFARIGTAERASADLAITADYALGTAFIFADCGLLARAGWNMPSHRLSLINPSTSIRRPVGYVFGRAQARYYLHNISVNGSLFRDGPEQELKPLVMDYQLGVALGAQTARIEDVAYDILLTLAYTYRTEEYKQQDSAVQFGSIVLGIGREF